MKIEIVVDPSRPAPAASLAARVAPPPAAAAAPTKGATADEEDDGDDEEDCDDDDEWEVVEGPTDEDIPFCDEVM